MRKIYKKLTKQQRANGIVFTSTLSRHTTELVGDTIHVVYENDMERYEKINNLKDDKFFNDSPWKYNIIRT